MAADDAFLDDVANSLAQLPGAIGVALGGSRAQGTSRPDSDWDFSIYYRGTFEPDHVRALGWSGQTTDLGGWGRPFYPDALRRSAPEFWIPGARMTLHYALAGHAPHGRIAQCAGLISEAGCRAGHAILAHRGEWITNEKQLLVRSGLTELNDVVAQLAPDAGTLVAQAQRASRIIEDAFASEGISPAT